MRPAEPIGNGGQLAVSFEFTVNGEPVEVEATGTRRLLDVLREDLGLTGTKEGCGEGECGACSVLIDGAVVDACLVPVSQAQRASVRTVEGLADDGRLGVLQQAFLETGGAQCGICTPGMLMAGDAFLASGARAQRREHPRGDRGQPVPLHRLHEDHRRHRAGSRTECVPMTDETETLDEAIEDHDVTLALTPGQLLLLVIGVYLLLRFIRGLRG